MRLALVVLVALFTLGAWSCADAATRFGVGNRFHTITELRVSPLAIERGDVPAEWGDGVVLANRVETRNFLLGVYARDAGYVIKSARDDRYWALDGDKTAHLQALKILPTPMPRYPTPYVDLALGFSLWIVLTIAGALAGTRLWKPTRHLPKEAQPSVPVAAPSRDAA